VRVMRMTRSVPSTCPEIWVDVRESAHTRLSGSTPP